MKKVLLWLVLSAFSSAAMAADGVFTLYRSSVVDPQMRIHVATFDTTEGGEYNAENCQLAARLFLSQPGVKTLFWCESGRFKLSE
ncbi:hypothetical protein [Leisingera sp.]|uniref:hypothetical protein n=1 Tax=Leisingera sp. TaxID=1879318 RepID=UPI002B268F54|nr:hypothetical protein [Leisingera sp.]